MSTRAESAASAAAKKGPSKKKARKLQQRKPKTASHPSANAARKHTRTKSDAPRVLTAEVEASSSDARARRDQAKGTRVRSSSQGK